MHKCSRCWGTGKLEHYGHVEHGVCFKCHGSGKQQRKPTPVWQLVYNGQAVVTFRAKDEDTAMDRADDEMEARFPLQCGEVQNYSVKCLFTGEC